MKCSVSTVKLVDTSTLGAREHCGRATTAMILPLMSDKTRYVSSENQSNVDSRKYHTDTDCPMLHDDYREVTDHDERMNILPCTFCAGGFRAEDIRRMNND